VTPASSARAAMAAGMMASNVTVWGGAGGASAPRGCSIVEVRSRLFMPTLLQPPLAALPIASSPTICTAMTFTMVMDGKIIA
jgi:hypothetical protein